MDLNNFTSYDYHLNLTVLVESETSSRPWWWSDATGWGVLGALGLFANASLALALCGARAQAVCYPRVCGPRACIPRTRSPLTLGLCLADALICTISIPIGIVNPWPSWLTDFCKLLFFLQAFPVAASTLSLMAIALDRLTTLQYPRFMSSLHRRTLLILVTFSIWFVSAILTAPILFVGRIRSNTDTSSIAHIDSDVQDCPEIWTSEQLRKVYVITYLVMVYLTPMTTVTVCHFVMRSKLTALSLTARARQGELPLPIPLLRRPTHVIIVAGVTNNPHGKVLKYHNGSSESYSDESIGNLVERYDVVCRKAPRRSGRPVSTETEIRRQHRRKQCERRPIQREPRYNSRSATSTLRSRRRLANALVSASVVFTGCWLPHVACALYAEMCGDEAFGMDANTTTIALHYTVLLGYAHSAVNPIVHWALNQQVAAAQPQPQPPPLCELFWCVRASTTDRSGCPNAPSSTNEAALGPFHPRLVRSVKRKPPADSSHYLY